MDNIPELITNLLKKQKYHIVGHHSAIKKCRWTHNSLVYNRVCYKQKFYGVKSHRCMQITPSLIWCSHACQFCWRIQPQDIKLNWNQTKISVPIDSPKKILDGCIREWRRILSGYKPSSHKKVDWKKWKEANEPFSVAISLSGEPTLYPFISDLIFEIKKRNLIAFLVTNGTFPEVLKNIEEPNQLYVSVIATNKKEYKKICRPLISDGWERLNKTFELIPSFNCPTVFRLTLMHGMNLKNPEEFAKIINNSTPTYVECKGYMYLGFSRKRGLTLDHMPRHEEIKLFSEKISALTGYKILDESIESRVVLLSRLDKPKKFSQ
ncbi:MAG: 4-demethylwyosine synthase TYW1 [Candidatus Helarchaeota archaeon]